MQKWVAVDLTHSFLSIGCELGAGHTDTSELVCWEAPLCLMVSAVPQLPQ